MTKKVNKSIRAIESLVKELNYVVAYNDSSKTRDLINEIRVNLSSIEKSLPKDSIINDIQKTY